MRSGVELSFTPAFTTAVDVILFAEVWYMSMLLEYVREKVAAANKLLIQEFESERAHHQKLVKEHARLQQRLENLHSEMQVSPTHNVLSIKSLI